VNSIERHGWTAPKRELASLRWRCFSLSGMCLIILVAALLKQAEALNIPPTKSLLFRDMAFEIEAGMRQKR
jgi:hypothetical protein